MKRSVRNKSKVSIWTKIKNIYNKNSFNAAFSYPILAIILAPILLALIGYLSGGNESLLLGGFLFMTGVYVLVPTWVLIGLIVSKKKLPYTLSLIIGFGLLYFLFNFADHYSDSSRISATKTVHAMTVRYISTEIQKCKKGETAVMNGELNCSNYDNTSIIAALIKTRFDVNPHNTTYISIRPSSSNTKDEDVGYVSLSSSGSNIIIKSCNKTPCKKEENRLQDSIEIE
jgi:hypothetical protein